MICQHCNSSAVTGVRYTVEDNDAGRMAVHSCLAITGIKAEELPALPATFELMKCTNCGKRSVKVIK